MLSIIVYPHTLSCLVLTTRASAAAYMDCTFRMSAHHILTMCSLFSYVHNVYILRATSSSPTLLQPRAVSPGVGAVLQPHKASRRPHSHSSGPGLIPSFPDLFQVHYCSFVGLCVRNVRMHMQNCVCVRMDTHAELLLAILGVYCLLA